MEDYKSFPFRLKQGTKVKFKWWGNKEAVYTGRIEVDKYNGIYFINEHCFEGEEDLPLHQEGMRYYNRLIEFIPFTYFEILN